MFAFGVTAYDSNPEPIEDPTIGVLKPYYKSWGLDETIGGVDFELLPTRNCSEAELHINNQTSSDSPFFKPHKNSVNDLSFYYKKLKCLDMDSLQIQGDYNSPRARSFALMFEKCDNSTFTGGVCKSDEYIKDWMKRKFIIINMNKERFSNKEFSEGKRISKEASIEYIPLNS